MLIPEFESSLYLGLRLSFGEAGLELCLLQQPLQRMIPLMDLVVCCWLCSQFVVDVLAVDIVAVVVELEQRFASTARL